MDKLSRAGSYYGTKSLEDERKGYRQYNGIYIGKVEKLGSVKVLIR